MMILTSEAAAGYAGATRPNTQELNDPQAWIAFLTLVLGVDIFRQAATLRLHLLFSRCKRAFFHTNKTMQFLDYALQTWRMRLSARWIPDNSQVLDIGCHQGEFLNMLEPRLKAGSLGLDPLLQKEKDSPKYKLKAAMFDGSLQLPENSFDAVVMLATLEHLQDKDGIARTCHRLLRPQGRVVVTVPSPLADKVIDLLVFMRLLDGMSFEQHHGFEPKQLPEIFERHGFQMKIWKKFQLGLNNLFVFERAQ